MVVAVAGAADPDQIRHLASVAADWRADLAGIRCR